MPNWIPITSGVRDMLDNYNITNNIPVRVGNLGINTGAFIGSYLINPAMFVSCPEWITSYNIFITGGSAKINNKTINITGGTLAFSNGSGSGISVVSIITGNVNQFIV